MRLLPPLALYFSHSLAVFVPFRLLFIGEGMEMAATYTHMQARIRAETTQT